MAHFDFKLPDLGEGVTEGEVVSWHVKEGDLVAEDQIMVEVMTDKATVTIGSPRAGKVEKLMATVGMVVNVGDVLIVIQTGNGSRISAGLPAATAVGDIRDSLPGTGHFGEKRATIQAHAGGETTAPEHVEPKHEHPLATPATRKLARDLKLDLRRITGSGPHGRVTRDDVLSHSSPGTLPAPTTAAVSAKPPAARKPVAPAPAAGTRMPVVGMRRRIAENMSVSKNTAAHFTFVEECSVDRLVELRERLRPEARARGVELTYLPFVIKAVIAALKKHPMLNSSLDTEAREIVLHGSYHIGIAAATDSGLFVPVVRNADQRSLLELATEIERLGDAARDGKLTREELTGATFTITSLGKLGGLFAVPIINFPNVGILGVHQMKQRPVVRDGQIVIGQVMLLSLSLDHRIVDGHVGAAFAYDVIHFLEDPARLLLES
jgi:pyruvate dehydrogenase E2 component (dihydrolipoamide acetyltransferase)